MPLSGTPESQVDSPRIESLLKSQGDFRDIRWLGLEVISRESRARDLRLVTCDL